MLFRFKILSFWGVLKVFRPYFTTLVRKTFKLEYHVHKYLYLVVKIKFISQMFLECGRILYRVVSGYRRCWYLSTHTYDC